MSERRSSPRGRRATQSRPTWLFVVIPLLLYAYFVPRGIDWNADSHLDLTRALVDHHTAAIDAYQAGLGDKSYFHGHYYSDKAPGLSFLALPAYVVLQMVLGPSFFGPLFFVTRYLVTLLVVGLPAAVATAVLWRRLSSYVGARPAALAALGWALGTLAAPFSSQFFSHQVCAILLLFSFLLLYLPGAARQDGAPGPPAGAARLLGVGLLCGISVAAEYPTALLVGVLIAGHLARVLGHGWARAARDALLLGGGAVLGLAPAVVYNMVVFGGPLVQGYAYVAGEPQFVRGMSQGIMGVTGPSPAALWGITASPYRGLFVLCPMLLLALPGLVVMWRPPAGGGARAGGLRAAALVCLAAVVVYGLFNTSYYMWDGGYSVGPRHFVPALPFLVIPIAFALRRRLWLVLALPLMAISIVTMVVAMAVGPLFPPTLPNPVYGWAWPHVLGGHVNNNWGQFLRLGGLASLLPLIVCEVVLGLLLARRLGGMAGEPTP